MSSGLGSRGLGGRHRLRQQGLHCRLRVGPNCTGHELGFGDDPSSCRLRVGACQLDLALKLVGVGRHRVVLRSLGVEVDPVAIELLLALLNVQLDLLPFGAQLLALGLEMSGLGQEILGVLDRLLGRGL